ncbi:uncharacterized protein LTR77_010022 [Saxophila tyrrhenica]|uniref:Uncharacterized protein n=1 Tax=Saxophila tyrrhenica TaxID=1690608 RepID=A0AAV9NZG4_9PEZI|nr:hypothetical protein LTR77_010022 [Saxophila tyrrhenica]
MAPKRAKKKASGSQPPKAGRPSQVVNPAGAAQAAQQAIPEPLGAKELTTTLPAAQQHPAARQQPDPEPRGAKEPSPPTTPQDTSMEESREGDEFQDAPESPLKQSLQQPSQELSGTPATAPETAPKGDTPKTKLQDWLENKVDEAAAKGNGKGKQRAQDSQPAPPGEHAFGHGSLSKAPAMAVEHLVQQGGYLAGVPESVVPTPQGGGVFTVPEHADDWVPDEQGRHQPRQYSAQPGSIPPAGKLFGPVMAQALTTPARSAEGGFQPVQHRPTGAGAPFSNDSDAMDLTGDPAEDAQRRMPNLHKFSILEDDLGVKELIEKHSVPKPEDPEKLASYQTVNADTLPVGAQYTEPTHLYPMFLDCDKGKAFDLTRIFDYRGKDHHPMLNANKKKMHDKRPALISVAGVGSFGNPDPKVKDSPDGLFHFCEFQIRPDTQVPVFVIRLRRPAKEGDTAASWVRLEIPAGCLARNANDVGVKFAHADNKVKVGMPNIPVLTELAKKDVLYRTDLELWSADDKPTTGATGKRIWYGLNTAASADGARVTHELDVIRATPTASLSTFQKAVLVLDTATNLSIYSEVKDTEVMQILPRCFDYVRAISYATTNLGYYWWYVVAGKGVPLDSPKFPFRDPKSGKWLPFPRWMITQFQVRYVKDEAASYTPEHIADFLPIRTSTQPDEKSALYLSRIAMAREMQAQEEGLLKLTERLEGRVVCRINTLADGGYFASLWFEGVTKGKQSDTIMPELKKRCNIFVTSKGGVGVKLLGAVCEDVLDTGAHCTVHCLPSEPSSALLEDGDTMEATVKWPFNPKSANRSMNALLSIAEGHPDRNQGVALANVALGAPVPEGQNTATFSTQGGVDGARHKKIIRICEALGCNESQVDAAWQLLRSKDGLSLIWGPPGTGKTKGAMALVIAMILNDVKILVTAASNMAVKAAAQSFEEAVNKLDDSFKKEFGTIDPIDWCTFTGAQFETDTTSSDAQGVWEDRADNLASDMAAMSVPLSKDGDEPPESSKAKPKKKEKKRDLIWYLTEHGLLPESQAGVDKQGDTNMDSGTPAAGDQPAADEQPAAADKLPATSLNWADEMQEEDEKKLEAEIEKSRQRQLAQVIRTAYNNLQEGHTDESFSAKKLRFISKFTTGPWEENVNAPKEDPANAAKYFGLLEIIQEANDSKKITKAGMDKLMKDFIAVDEYWVKRYFTKCRLVFVTNNSSCHPALALYFQPILVLIDEAGFSMPADAMIPMASHKNSIRHIVLVGDHKQLKAVASSGGHNECFPSVQVSLFEKLIEDEVTPRDSVQYNVQYRQNPNLSEFFRERVYKEFNDHPSVRVDNDTRVSFRALMSRVPVWNNRLRVGIANEGHSGIFRGTASACNLSEAKLCLDLAAQLIGHGAKPEDITICTPYGGQLRLLGALARATKQVPALADVHIATVNEMLGHENKIVILSFVQHNAEDDLALGFIYHRWLITVATSRARDGLIIVGNLRGWMKAILSSGPEDFINRGDVKLFRDLTQEMYDHNDILAQEDIEKAFAGEKVDTNTFYTGLLRKAPALNHKGNIRGGRGRGRGNFSNAGLDDRPFDEAQPGIGNPNKRHKRDDAQPTIPDPGVDLIGAPRGRGRGGGRGGGRGDGRGGRGGGRGDRGDARGGRARGGGRGS